MKKLLTILFLIPIVGYSQGYSGQYFKAIKYIDAPLFKISGTSIDTSTSTIRWFTKHKMDMLTTAYNKPSSQWTNSTYPTIYYSYNTGIGAAPTAYNMFYIYDYEDYMDTHDYIGLKITGNYGRYVEDAYDCGNYYGIYISANHTVPMNSPTINYGMYCNVSGGNTNYSAILMGGNVGIGTISPSKTLDVNGSINGTSYYLNSISLTPKLFYQKNIDTLDNLPYSNSYIKLVCQDTVTKKLYRTRSTRFQTALTNPITGDGSGTNNYLATYTGANAIKSNSLLTYDGTTLNVGTTTTGNNASINATYGTEQAPALTSGNWTLGTGWQYLTSPNRLDKNTNGTGTATPTATTTISAGTTYKVVIVVDAISGSTASCTLGGTSGVNLTAATTYTEYITASTTGKLIITPVATALRITISSISIIPLTDNTGDLTVNGNLFVNSPIKSSGGTDAIYITKSGNVSILGKNNSDAFNFTVNGSGYYSNILQAQGAITSYSAIMSAIANITTGFTIGLRNAAGSVASAVNTTRNSPTFASTSYAWNGSASKENTMCITTIPTAAATTSSRLAFNNYIIDGTSNTSELMSLTSSGNLGLGITAPTSKLHIDGGNATASYTQYTAGTTTGQTATDGIRFGINTDGRGIINQQENLGIEIRTNNVKAVRIDSVQNITTNGTSLDVSGQIAFKYNATTGERCLCILVTADEAIAKGNICSYIQGGTASRVKKTPKSGNENDMPVGVAFTSAAGAGSTFWMAIQGVVQVLPESTETAAQGYVITASTTTAGTGLGSATVPVAATHFKEVGHYTKNGTGAGALTNAIIHFN